MRAVSEPRRKSGVRDRGPVGQQAQRGEVPAPQEVPADRNADLLAEHVLKPALRQVGDARQVADRGRRRGRRAQVLQDRRDPPVELGLGSYVHRELTQGAPPPRVRLGAAGICAENRSQRVRDASAEGLIEDRIGPAIEHSLAELLADPALAFDPSDRGQAPIAAEPVADVGVDQHAAGAPPGTVQSHAGHPVQADRELECAMRVRLGHQEVREQQELGGPEETADDSRQSPALGRYRVPIRALVLRFHRQVRFHHERSR